MAADVQPADHQDAPPPHPGPVLVTGGGGFLGGAVARRLLARGTPVRIFSRRPLPDLGALGATVARGDLEDRPAVLAACDGVAAVVHAAARPGVHAPARVFYGPNVLGTYHVVDGCLTHRVPTLVHISSPSVVFDGTPHAGADESLPLPRRGAAHYPHSKLLAERAVLRADRARGVRTVAVRPHLIWGPGDRHVLPAVVRAIKKGVVPAVGGAAPLVAPTYVDNAAAAVVAVLDGLPGRPRLAGEAYFVNDLPPVTPHAFIDRAADAAGLPRPARRRVPAALAGPLGLAAETAWRLAGRGSEPPLTRFALAQLSVPHWYDTAALDAFGPREVIAADEAWRRAAPFLRELAGTDGVPG